MLDGNFAEQTFLFPEHRPYPQEPQETSGITLGSQGIYKYSLKSSEYPSIIIVDDISDGFGNYIEKGYYEIALSDERDFFIIMQTNNPVAIVPVFKIVEDKSKYDKELQKIKKKQEKERQKTNEKRAKVNMQPDEEKIHMEASVNYVKDGDYYLIEYERGPIRAWGAIKSN